MIWVYVVLVLGWLLFLTLVLKQKIASPAVLFGIVWLLVFILGGLKLFGMTEYSIDSVNIMGIGVNVFMLGSVSVLLWRKHKNRNKSEESIDTSKVDGLINYKIVYVLLAIGIIALIPVAVKVTSLLADGVSYGDIRSMFYSYGDSQSLLPNEQLFTLFDWYTLSTIAATTSLLVVDIVSRRQIKKMAIALFAIFTILFVYATAGRMRLIVIILDIVLTISICSIKLDKKMKKWFKVVGLGLFIIFVAMTFGRGSKNSENVFIGQRAYYYMALPMPYFSNIIDYVDKNQAYTNGAATLYGPYLLVQKPVKVLTGYKFSGAEFLDDAINSPQRRWVKVYEQSKDYYNAFASLFYNFYLDFRWVGVVIFSFLYGLIVELFYVFMMRKKTIAKVAVYLIIALGLIMSFAHWQLASPDVLIAFFMVFICTRQRTKDDDQRERVN